MTTARRLRAGLACLAFGILGTTDIHAQTRVGGGAHALALEIDGLASITPNPEVVLPDEGGDTEAHLLSTGLPGIVSTATLTAESSGSVGLASATATSEGRVESLDILDGLVTADLLIARASSTGNGTTATSTAAGSQFVNLFVAGIPIVVMPPPNTVIPIPGVGSVILNEQVAGGNGTASSALTVNMVHVVLNGLLDGHITVGSASSEVDVRPLSNTCACPNDDDTVSGEAFGTLVDVLSIDVGRNPHAILSDQGGSASAQALGVSVTNLVSSATVTSTTAGAITPTMATSDSDTAVEQLRLLGGLITADAVQASAACVGNGSIATCSAAGSTLANLRVGALVLNVVPPPNTVIPLPLVGSLILNQQIVAGNGTTTRSLTVHLLRINLNGILGQGDIIVASAQAGVDFDPPSGCQNVCDDGNPCNGVEMCGPTGCIPGPPPTCDDGNPCNGTEGCDPTSGCTMGTPLVCNDGNVCNGLETCDPQTGCRPGTTLPCSDGDACNGTETCDPTSGCQPSPGPACNDNDPCNGVETCDAQGGCIPGLPPFMADVDARVKDGGTVQGDFGINSPGGRLQFGRGNVATDGTTLLADRVSLGNGTSVFDVRTNNLVVGQDVAIRGATGPASLPLTTNYCPVPAFAPCSGNDVLVPASGVTGPIAPGTYRNLRVPNGATVLLAPGSYRFCNVIAGRGSAIRITGATATTIDVHGSVKIGNNSMLAPDGGTPRPTINAGGHQVRLGSGTTMEALLSAPNARMSMGRTARMAGTFCVDRLNTDHSTVLQCP